jgi:ATP-dependent Clp protease ATP-binding subunit ClpA
MDDNGPVPTPRYRSVVGGSTKLAQEMDHSYVGVEHLFLAIIRDRGAVPTQVLATLIDLDQVEAALLADMESPGYKGAPPPGVVSFPRDELRGRLAALEKSGAKYRFNVAGDQAWIVVDE